MSVGSFTNQYYKLVHYAILIFNQITYMSWTSINEIIRSAHYKLLFQD